MMRAYAFNSHVDCVRTEMTVTKQIPILHVCSTDRNEPKGIIADENLLKVCSKEGSKPERVIVDESSTENSK